jgi:anion-transporting  ArsA/GET3 family ATPase
MATDKQYTVCGISTVNGDTKLRFANDTMRIKVLSKNGHTDIQLVELPQPMLKTDAAKFIAGLPEFDNAVAKIALAEYLDKNVRTVKARVQVKKAVKAAVAVKPARVAVSKVREDEDAPF